MSCWHCGSILVSYTIGGWVAGLSLFTVMTNIFVTEFSEFSETFRKNSSVPHKFTDEYRRQVKIKWSVGCPSPPPVSRSVGYRSSLITFVSLEAAACNFCFNLHLLIYPLPPPPRWRNYVDIFNCCAFLGSKFLYFRIWGFGWGGGGVMIWVVTLPSPSIMFRILSPDRQTHRQTDRHDWKHYLLTCAGGKK